MFFIIPTGSDAPLRHWPIATGVTIAINVVFFVLQTTIPGFTDSLILEFGSFNPLTWLTAAYLHGDFFHLFGNMMFLFIYGLIVEGKIGWWRFLLVYNTCAVSSGVLISLWTMFYTAGACLGASCAIFGIMLICFLWAPENEVSFTVVGVFFFRPFVYCFDATVQNLCFFFVAMNFVIAAFTEFAMSSEVLHLLGAIPGVVIGSAMLKMRRVNCDGYDLFSIMSGKQGQCQLTVEELAQREQECLARKRERRAEFDKGMEMVDFYVSEKHYEMAIMRFDSLRHLKKGLEMDESLMVELINGLAKKPEKASTYRSMLQRYLEHYERLRVPVTMKLVRLILTTEQAPRRAMRLLLELDSSSFSKNETRVFRTLVKAAKQQISEGVIELQSVDFNSSSRLSSLTSPNRQASLP